MMTKTLILFLTLGIAAAGVVEVDNMMAIGRYLKAENFTTAEDFELEQASKGLGAIVLAETSGKACNQGSGRAQQRCNELARRVFGNTFVSSATVTMYHNMVDQCSFNSEVTASFASALIKTLVGEAIKWTKAFLHCKVCQSSSWCHQKVKDGAKFANCMNQVTNAAIQGIIGGNRAASGSMTAVASWASGILYTGLFKLLPACAEDDVTEIINSYNSKYAKKFNFTIWDALRFITNAVLGQITSKIAAHIANAVAAFAVPGFGTAWSAAKFGWSLYSLAKNCRWDVQASISSVIQAGVSLYEAATGGTNTSCAWKLKTAIVDVFDLMICWFNNGGNIYKKAGCSSRMIRQFA